MCSKIFCFDLDMTLLDHKTFHISEKVLKDLEALKKEGHVVAVATGRDMDSEFSKAYKKTASAGCNRPQQRPESNRRRKKDPGSLHGSEADRPHDGVLP